MSKGPDVGVFRHTAGTWIGLIAAWGVVALAGLFWLAGGIASWLMGSGLTGPAFGFDFGKNLVVKGPSSLWPGVPLALILGIFLIELAVLGIPSAIIVVGILRRQTGPDPTVSLAIQKDLFNLTPDGVRIKALSLRPRLDEELTSARDRKGFELAEAGVPIGALDRGGVELRASWEDVALSIMAPRSGKTTAQAIPAVLDAPGPALVTSNKPDVWAATAAIRRRDKGRVWVFDPQAITRVPQTWWWNPLKDLTNYEAALRLASHFMQEIKANADAGSEDSFWVTAAADVLTCLFLAAGRSGLTLLEVYEWLNDPTHDEPIRILRENGELAAAHSLNARQSMEGETRESIYEFARTACRCLRNKDIMQWVVPPHISDLKTTEGEYDEVRAIDLRKESGGRLEEFHPDGFADTTETMYLLSKDGAAAAAPLVAALTDRLLVDATRTADLHRRGRLDPPMVVVLDEAANICKIADLPLLYSHLGSRGIFVMTILQSRPQARQVWGRDGFETMWSAATVKLIGAGIDDPELADDISRLVGEHDISIRSVSTGTGGEFSESHSLRKEAIMSPSAVRAMPKGRAILLATGSVPASIRLQPWYAGPRADEIDDAMNFALEASQLLAQSAATADQWVPDEQALAARQAPAPPPVPADKTPTAELVTQPWGHASSAVLTSPQPLLTREVPSDAPARPAVVISQDGDKLGSGRINDDGTHEVSIEGDDQSVLRTRNPFRRKR